MGKYTNILKRLQEERLEVSQTIETEGYQYGLERAEQIVYEEQKKGNKAADYLWYTGSPEDLKENNTGDYVLILRAHFDSEDGIKNGNVYITSDYWNGECWQGYEISDSTWEVLYFCKLKWLNFPLPTTLGLNRNSSMFLH